MQVPLPRVIEQRIPILRTLKELPWDSLVSTVLVNCSKYVIVNTVTASNGHHTTSAHSNQHQVFEPRLTGGPATQQSYYVLTCQRSPTTRMASRNKPVLCWFREDETDGPKSAHSRHNHGFIPIPTCLNCDLSRISRCNTH